MSGIRRSGLNVGGIRRSGVKPHRSVLEGKAKTEAYYFQRNGSVTQLLREIMAEFKNYNRSERLVIRRLDYNDRTYLNSAAGPKIIQALEMIRQTRAKVADLHKYLGV